MLQRDIKEIEKYFSEYNKDNECRKLFRKTESFDIVIHNSGEVYQTNSDHEIQGAELVTLEDFEIRYESWTGEKLWRSLHEEILNTFAEWASKQDAMFDDRLVPNYLKFLKSI